jgi:hypothetical protein
MEDLGQLTADVRQAALREVALAYQTANWNYFSKRLRAPLFEWSERSTELGAWVSEHRTLRLSVELLLSEWGSLVEILKHEMAHQYVDEVLGVRDEGPHGPTFQELCRRLGIDGRARGGIRPPEQPTKENAALRRILHLLSLAESDNPHEAENAAALARRLMLKYQIETAAASTGDYTYRHLGKPLGRRHAYQRVIATILDEHFFVSVIIVPVYCPLEKKRGSVLEACGSLDNLEIAAYAHDFLELAGERLWRAHKKQQGIRADRDRLDYLLGVMSGFREKLAREAQKSEKEGLVLAEDPRLKSYFRSRHPYIRSVSGRGSVEREAFGAGKQAGGALVLSKGIKGGTARDGGPRLLPGK